MTSRQAQPSSRLPRPLYNSRHTTLRLPEPGEAQARFTFSVPHTFQREWYGKMWTRQQENRRSILLTPTNFLNSLRNTASASLFSRLCLHMPQCPFPSSIAARGICSAWSDCLGEYATPSGMTHPPSPVFPGPTTLHSYSSFTTGHPVFKVHLTSGVFRLTWVFVF